MNVTSSDRPGAAANPAPLPLLLLLLALSTVFLFGHHDREYFYRPGHHDGISVHYMAVSANLSPEHNFLMFFWETLDGDGARVYAPYSRFPIGGHALIKLVILPFSSSLTQQIYAARMLMLLFFVGAAVLAYLAVFRLASNRWTALTATLLAFSSYYCLYYNDSVSTEGVMDFFGVMLTFHGMVLFVQEGRFRQLLVKACVALLLGWHVYALLLPFIVFGAAGELFRTSEHRRPVVALLSSPYLLLGMSSVFFGTLLLGFNLASEYFAMNATSVAELSTVKSMLKRFGLNETFNTTYADRLAWLPFLKTQFSRVGGMSLPYLLSGYSPGTPPVLPGIAAAFVVLGACLAGLARHGRHRLLMATLAVSGFCWALPMRHNTFTHDFESLFYIGIPLVFYCLILQHVHRLYGDRLAAGLSVAALLVFVLSSFQMSHIGRDEDAAIGKEVVADFEVIRRLTTGQTVTVTKPVNDDGFDEVPWSTMYYLGGSVIVTNRDRDLADFLVTDERLDGMGLLTPQNRRVFLYHRPVHDWMVATGSGD